MSDDTAGDRSGELPGNRVGTGNSASTGGARGDSLEVAVAQVRCDLGELAANASRHAERIREARELGVELLLFPELSLTGYGLGANILDVARSRDDPLIVELAGIAPEMTVVLGLVEEGPAAQLYNTALVLRGGGVLHLHRKLNLPNYGLLEEGKLFASGNYVETFTSGAPWRQSVLICADLWNPALVHLAMLHGATMLLAPVNSAIDAVGGGFSNLEGWRLAVRFYAMMYGMPILMANRVGEEAGARFWGGSCIVDPSGEVLVDAGEEETLLHARLDFADVRRARFRLPTVRDSNANLVHRELGRLVEHVGVPSFVRKPHPDVPR